MSNRQPKIDTESVLTVSEARAGEELHVTSTNDPVIPTTPIEAYVDDNGIVRQRVNDGCFNADSYEVEE